MESSIGQFEKLRAESKSVFSLIQKSGPVTKSNLLRSTKMKLTTLNRVLLPLESGKLIIQTGVEESTGGRRPVRYDVNEKLHYAVGVELSRTHMQVVLTNLKMQIIRSCWLPMTASCTPQMTVKAIADRIHAFLKKESIEKKQILGIGIGTVGPLDREKGIMLRPRNFPAPGWLDVPIKELLEEEAGIPVTIDNGANTAVLAEFLYGCGKGLKSIAYINCGIGIRTGAITSGNLIRTINDVEDAFGHMAVDVDGEACSCGNRGCLECYGSLLSIERKYLLEREKGRPSHIAKRLQDITYMDVCAAAEQNDALAREVITDAAAVFGIGLANYINLICPQLVILSGWLVKHSSLFFETCVQTAAGRHYLREEGKVIFCRGGDFGDQAIAAGGAVMLMENLLA